MMKNILVVSTVPCPPIMSGSQKCIFEYCHLLKSLGHNVSFLYIHGLHKPDIKVFERMKEYWGDNLYIYKRYILIEGFIRFYNKLRKKIYGFNKVDDFYPYGINSTVKKIITNRKIDAVIVNYVTLSKILKCGNVKSKILFTHDCMSFKRLRFNEKNFWCDLSPSEEAKGLQRADIVLSINSNESIYFSYLHPHGKIVDVFSPFPIKKQNLCSNMNILFLSGKNKLNINGITHFINYVFPIVKKEIPQVNLYIGGKICTELKAYACKNIRLIGPVDNPDDFYALGDIAINPIFQGTGLKIKTFESLSYGKVTVVNPHSAEGIFNTICMPLLIGDSDEIFAKHLINVLKDRKLREEYSQRSIQYISIMNEFIKKQYNSIF